MNKRIIPALLLTLFAASAFALPLGANPPGNGGNNSLGCLNKPGFKPSFGCNHHNPPAPPPAPTPAPAPVTNVNAAAAASAKAQAELIAQQKLIAQQQLSGTVSTKGGSANTVGGEVETTVGVKIDGSAGGNKLSTGDSFAQANGNGAKLSDVGNASLNGKVFGSFDNDGRQSTEVKNTAGGAKLSDVGSGNGNGNGAKVDLTTGGATGGAGGKSDSAASATGNGAGNMTSTGVTTNNTSTNKVLYVNLPTAPAVAPTVTATGGITMVGTCGPLKKVVSTPIEYLLVGHVGMDKVQLSGQTTDTLEDAFSDGKPYETVDNGDGTWSEFGSIASIAVITVSGSTSKQFGLGIIGGSGGGSASNGSAGTVSITQKVAAVGSCERRKWRTVVVPATPPVSQNEISDAIKTLGNMVLRVDVPTQRVETDQLTCKVKKFKNLETGKEVEMCNGAKGTYAHSRVVNDRVTATSTMKQAAAAGAAAK